MSAPAAFSDSSVGVVADSAQPSAPDAVAVLNDASTDAGEGVDASSVVDAGVPPEDAGTPAVRYVGRFEMSAPGGPRAAWPATRAVLRFEGTALSVELAQVNGYQGGPTYVDVLVDGTLAPSPLVVPSGTHSFEAASGLAWGAHTVEFVKRTEADYGELQFRRFTYPGGGRLLAPPAARPRRIELLGNSAISGYGIEGTGPTCPGSASVQNARKTVGVLVSDALNADLSLVAYSGKGITRNWVPGDTNTFSAMWQRISPDNASAGTAAASSPDAFVLAATGLDAESSDAVMSNGYTTFVANVRAAYPAAHIFLVTPAALNDDYPVGMRTRSRFVSMFQTISAQRAAAGDNRVYAYAMANGAGQMNGCDSHPSAALHVQMAGELQSWLSARLGW